jgi:hypothetical protein
MVHHLYWLSVACVFLALLLFSINSGTYAVPKSTVAVKSDQKKSMVIHPQLKERVAPCQQLGDGKMKSTCCTSMCLNDMNSPFSAQECMKVCHAGQPIKSVSDISFKPVV